MKQVISIPIVDTTIHIILHFIFIDTTFNQIFSFQCISLPFYK